MKEPTLPGLAKRMDDRSYELMAEFRAFRDEIMAENPDDPKLSDERIIFESWALQQIAGLQCALQDLAKDVHEKKNRKGRR